MYKISIDANHDIQCNKSDCFFLTRCTVGNRTGIGSEPDMEPRLHIDVSHRDKCLVLCSDYINRSRMT